MIKLFLRSAAKGQFRTRSRQRDQAGDRSLLEPIEKAIEHAITSLQSQQDGLKLRIEDALGRASLTVGNDTYEHDTRDPVESDALKRFENEMTNARARLVVVEDHMANLRFLRAVFLSRFPKRENEEQAAPNGSTGP